MGKQPTVAGVAGRVILEINAQPRTKSAPSVESKAIFKPSVVVVVEDVQGHVVAEVSRPKANRVKRV